jgi:hypothetical protein
MPAFAVNARRQGITYMSDIMHALKLATSVIYGNRR